MPKKTPIVDSADADLKLFDEGVEFAYNRIGEALRTAPLPKQPCTPHDTLTALRRASIQAAFEAYEYGVTSHAVGVALEEHLFGFAGARGRAEAVRAAFAAENAESAAKAAAEVTSLQIADLRREANLAGDDAMARLCTRALESGIDSSAWRECARVIHENRANG